MSLANRFRARPPRELLLRACLRLWPLSVVTRTYYRLRFWKPVWLGLLNRGAEARFKNSPVQLSADQEEIVGALNRDGIALASIDQLMGDSGVLVRLHQEAEALLGSPAVRRQVEENRSSSGGKHYVIRSFGEKPIVDLQNELTRFALNDTVLAVVNSYLGMFCRLKSFDLWFNLPVQQSDPEVASQKWHRDYDDYKLVKVFLYLADVDEKMGAMMYMRETQNVGKYRNLFPQNPPEGSYPPAGELERALPADQAMSCAGRVGTVVFCDTTGFHKGGRSTTKPRLLFTATYASNGAIDPDRYSLLKHDQYSGLSDQAKYALGITNRSRDEVPC